MSVLHQIWHDLRTKKLWPVAAGLLVAIVAVPVLLSSSGGAPPAAPVAVAPGPVSNGLPAVNESSVPSTSAPRGRARDPFAPANGRSTSTTATTTAATGITGTNTGPTTSGSGGSSAPTGTGSTSPTTPSTGGQSPSLPPAIPVPKPKHTTPSLGSEESYSVALAITNPAGGLDTINPLQRLSLLPSASQPLVVELGVLRGGSRVLFAVQPGTVVSGRGICIPGPIDCEILSLAQAQTEKLSIRSAHGVVPVAMFAVTGITAVRHSSKAATQKARRAESAAGRRVLARSDLNALSLFRYEPSVGAVVDLRNLTLRNN
jgi:hypothetical protein